MSDISIPTFGLRFSDQQPPKAKAQNPKALSRCNFEIVSDFEMSISNSRLQEDRCIEVQAGRFGFFRSEDHFCSQQAFGNLF